MRHSLVVLGLAVTALGCSSPTVGGFHELTGRWQSTREALQPTGSYQTTLTFEADGRVTVDVRSYGLYPGQRPDDLAAYSRVSGAFHTDATSLTIVPQELASWDRFYGADSPEQIVKPYAGSVYPDAHYSLEANVLTLHYTSAPFDAPVPTTATFVRVR